MTHSALRIIREEHRALGAMLRSIPMLLAESRRTGVPPDFAALRAMLFYVDEFPEQRHHRIESELLFPKLRARSPLARGLLDQLDAEHARSGLLVREIAHALTAFELIGNARRATFEARIGHYVEFYLRHMALEEREILPLASQTLTAIDWQELDRAFESNRDPLTGHAADADYRALFTKILNAVPAPFGLGSPVAA